MSALNSSTFSAPSLLVGSIKAFADEAFVLADALLNPRKIIDEVEQMRALQVEADRIEATDPTHAAVLRRRASRIGLR
jgi:hypothetical protein